MSVKLACLFAAISLMAVARPISAQGVYVGRIDGDFNGWEGETVYKLQDGHVIQQASYHYHYHYAYAPKVIIYKTSQGLMMKVDGDNDQDIKIVVLK